MKISAMTTDQALDTLVRLTEPAGVILTDKEISTFLDGLGAENGNKNFFAIGIDAIAKLIPAMARTHRAETYEIVSVLTGKSVEEIGSQKIKQTIQDVRDSWDEELAGFFHSLRAQTKNKETK